MFKRLLHLGSFLSFTPLAGCAVQSETASGNAPRSPAPSQAEPFPAPKLESEREPIVAHLMAAGDLLIHDALNADSYLAESGSYNYTHIMEQAAGQLARADYAFANLETSLEGGPNYSG